METQNIPIAKAILTKKNRAGRKTPFLRPHYKVTIIKTIWYGHKNKDRSKEEDGKPRNKPMYPRSINLKQRRQVCTMEERQSHH